MEAGIVDDRTTRAAEARRVIGYSPEHASNNPTMHTLEHVVWFRYRTAFTVAGDGVLAEVYGWADEEFAKYCRVLVDQFRQQSDPVHASLVRGKHKLLLPKAGSNCLRQAVECLYEGIYGRRFTIAGNRRGEQQRRRGA